jgi:hypothetical protein
MATNALSYHDFWNTSVTLERLSATCRLTKRRHIYPKMIFNSSMNDFLETLRKYFVRSESMILVFDLHHQLSFTCDSLSQCAIYLCRIISKGINYWESYSSDTTNLLRLYHDLWCRSLTVDITLLAACAWHDLFKLHTNLHKVIVVPGRRHIQLTRFKYFYPNSVCWSIKTDSLISHDNKIDEKSPNKGASTTMFLSGYI